MAKKEKTVELKPKVDKISEQHLTELQDVVNKLNEHQFGLGRMEVQKHTMLHDIAVLTDKIKLQQDMLMKEYGSYDINLKDGTINWENKDGKQ